MVAIDADRRLIEHARATFADAVTAGRLHLIHAAVALSSGTIPFHLSDNSEWNSLSSDIATRKQLGMTTIEVQAVRLPDVFRAHGTPDYSGADWFKSKNWHESVFVFAFCLLPFDLSELEAELADHLALEEITEHV